MTLTVYATVYGRESEETQGEGGGSVYRRGDGRAVGEYVDANGKRRYVSGRTKPEACFYSWKIVRWMYPVDRQTIHEGC